MKILENPNPAKSKVHVCEKCQCKFEFTKQDVKVNVSSDANGRLGGTHYYSRQVSVACPNCGEPYIIERKSGYSSSDMPGDSPLAGASLFDGFHSIIDQDVKQGKKSEQL